MASSSRLGAPPAWGPDRGSLGGVLRAGDPAVAQAGVLEGPRVRLKNGLARTKTGADLGAGDAAPPYPVSSPAGRTTSGGRLKRSCFLDGRRGPEKASVCKGQDRPKSGTLYRHPPPASQGTSWLTDAPSRSTVGF